MRASIFGLALVSSLAAAPVGAAVITYAYEGNVMTCDPMEYVNCDPSVTYRLSGGFSVDEEILGMSLRNAEVRFEVWNGDLQPPINADAIVDYDFGNQTPGGPFFEQGFPFFNLVSWIDLTTGSSRELISACLGSDGPPDYRFGCGTDSVFSAETLWEAPSGRWTTLQPIPAPASLPLLAAAAGIFAIAARRRRRAV